MLIGQAPPPSGTDANLIGPSAILAPKLERSPMDKLETLEELFAGRHDPPYRAPAW